MINYNLLYYFNELAQLQHYRKTAEKLCITQPSLTHSIKMLEQEFGVPLFVKDGRNVKLSKYGETLAKYTTDAFRSLDDGAKILSKFSKNNSGNVDLGCLMILGYKLVPDLISKFYQKTGFNEIKINICQTNTEDCINGILLGKYDIALCANAGTDDNICYEPFVKQKLVCIVSPSHPLASCSKVTMNDLASYPTIQYMKQVGEIQEIINKMYASVGIQPIVIQHCKEELSIAGYASTNMQNCIAIVPDLSILNNFAIKKIDIDNPYAFRNIYIATSTNNETPLCVGVFHTFLKSQKIPAEYI